MGDKLKRGLVRDCLNKLDKLSDDSWEDIVERYELDLNPHELRKRSYGMKMAYGTLADSLENDSSEQLLEIKKEKVKLSDLRSETNRQIRNLARIESVVDLLKDNIESLSIEKPMFTELKIKNSPSGNDGILCLSDLHIGMVVNNSVNKYDIEIAKERLQTVVESAIYNGKLHDIDKLHIILNGDLISGELHSSIKVSNAESLTKQIITASEIVANVIHQLSKHFFCTIATNIGNHEAVEFIKDDRSNGNNYSMLINEFMKLRLKDVHNIIFLDSIDNEMTVSRVKNLDVISCHGDQVSLSKCCEQLEMCTGVKPNLVVLGHYHKPMMMSQYSTEIYVNGSLVSTDDYAMKKKLYNPPSQTMLIVSEEGVDCSYIIKV